MSTENNEDKLFPKATGNYIARYKPSNTHLICKGTGLFSNEKLTNGIYVGYDDNETTISIVKDGVEYKQTFSEFIDNCINKPNQNEPKY